MFGNFFFQSFASNHNKKNLSTEKNKFVIIWITNFTLFGIFLSKVIFYFKKFFLLQKNCVFLELLFFTERYLSKKKVNYRWGFFFEGIKGKKASFENPILFDMSRCVYIYTMSLKWLPYLDHRYTANKVTRSSLRWMESLEENIYILKGKVVEWVHLRAPLPRFQG